MKHIWALKRCFMKDLLEAIPAPKPAKTTIATLLKRMIDKGFVAYKLYGNSREYYPLISKEDYFGKQLKSMISDFFDDSPKEFASFFTAKAKMNEAELMELRKIIDDQIKNQK